MRFEGKWLPDKDAFRKACIEIAENLDGFKRHPVYSSYIGNDTRGFETAKSFYECVKEMPYCSINDKIGNPVTHNLDGPKSAGTLRFMKVKKDVGQFNAKSVVEIGSGYGGQCVVMGVEDYTLIDIPESLGVAKAYLSALDVKAKFIDTNNIVPIEADLLISDYCLSELDKSGIDFYLENIKAKNGYFTINSQGEMREYLISKLREMYSVAVVDEFPKTSKHNNVIAICGGLM